MRSKLTCNWQLYAAPSICFWQFRFFSCVQSQIRLATSCLQIAIDTRITCVKRWATAQRAGGVLYLLSGRDQACFSTVLSTGCYGTFVGLIATASDIAALPQGLGVVRRRRLPCPCECRDALVVES